MLISEWKSLGKSAYVPFLAVVFLVMYCRLFQNQRIIIESMQAVFPVMASWWGIMIFYNFVEEEGNEVFFSFPMNRWWMGVGRCIVFYVLYIFLVFISILLCGLEIANIKEVFILLALQSFFYIGLGFILVLSTRSTGASLGIVMSYCSFQVLSKGNILKLLNIYYFNTQSLSINSVINKGIHIAWVSLLFFGIGQWLLIKEFKFR